MKWSSDNLYVELITDVSGDWHGERVACIVRGILVAGRSGRTMQRKLAKHYLALTVMGDFGLAIIDQYGNTFDSRIMCGDPAPDLKELSLELMDEFGLDVMDDCETKWNLKERHRRDAARLPKVMKEFMRVVQYRPDLLR